MLTVAVESACDRHGWILGYTVHSGNEHDSRIFALLYEKLKRFQPNRIVVDAGYKTPAIAHLLLADGVEPLFPYKRPMTRDGFFQRYEYAYDEYYDCYICPENQVLTYHTTNREGYQEYRKHLQQCTGSKSHVKTITRHVWEDYMEKADDIRHTIGNKEMYQLRKETIEQVFGTAKEQHGFRYTQYTGKAQMEIKAGLTFACMNLKKLEKILEKRSQNSYTIFIV